jgi:hypothetical protein
MQEMEGAESPPQTPLVHISCLFPTNLCVVGSNTTNLDPPSVPTLLHSRTPPHTQLNVSHDKPSCLFFGLQVFQYWHRGLTFFFQDSWYVISESQLFTGFPEKNIWSFTVLLQIPFFLNPLFYVSQKYLRDFGMSIALIIHNFWVFSHTCNCTFPQRYMSV